MKPNRSKSLRKSVTYWGYKRNDSRKISCTHILLHLIWEFQVRLSEISMRWSLSNLDAHNYIWSVGLVSRFFLSPTCLLADPETIYTSGPGLPGKPRRICHGAPSHQGLGPKKSSRCTTVPPTRGKGSGVGWRVYSSCARAADMRRASGG